MMTVHIGDRTSLRRTGANLAPEGLIVARELIEVRRTSQPVMLGRWHSYGHLLYERTPRRPAP